MNIEIKDEQFALFATGLVDHLATGMDASRHSGGITEYQCSQEWQPGDPLRAVDWRSFAATRQLRTRIYDDTRQTPVLIAVDQSDSMLMRSGSGLSKYETGLGLLGGLIHACMSAARPVSIVGSRSAATPRAATARPVLVRQLQALGQVPRHGGGCLISEIVDAGLSAMAHRRLLVVITDLTRAEDVASLQSWSLSQEILLLLVEDDAAACTDRAGFLSVREAESSPGTGGRLLRTGWQAHVAAHRARLETAGVEVCRISPGRSAATQLRDWLAQRKRRPQ